MQNTSNYQLEEGVLKSGVEIPTIADLELLKSPETRVYTHAVKGAKTHMPDGAEITFRGGLFATNNPDVIAMLDKIADKPGSMVFKGDRKVVLVEMEAASASAAAPAGDAKTGLTIS